MLFNKKNDKQLSKELFKNPTNEYRGAPFWAWNTKIKEDMLLEQIEMFKQMGIGGFHIHARTGMETPYLSDEFMHLVKLCNEKAKEEGMLCWLYDEDKWPSGVAGGFVSKNYRHRAKHFRLSFTDPRDQENFAKDYDEYLKMTENEGVCSGYMISRYGVKLDENGFLIDYKRLNENEDYDGDIWYGWMHIHPKSAWYNNQAYINTLTKSAVEEFARITYDAYYNAVGDDFGKSIPAIFTDEPQVLRHTYLTTSLDKTEANLPFADDFDETYKAVYGESILNKIPELVWEKKNNGCARTRYTYMDHMSERFVSAFCDTLGSWCKEHNIAFTGHMLHEGALGIQADSLGEAMRCYRSFQIPGMDLLCDRIEFSTAKQVQSVVHQYGREAMLSELYGVTGWDFAFKGHKRQGDWQAALGVTVRVHHLTWISMNGEAKRDYPASIGYQSPWYKQYNYIEDHFARLTTALSRGTPYVKVGVIHPIESFWLYTGPNDKTALKRNYIDEQFLLLTKALCYGGVDFDFIAESLLPDLCESGSNPLKVGKMEYDCIVVPVMETMRSSTLQRLNAFTKAGGKVFLLGSAPEYVDAIPSNEVKAASENWENINIDYVELIDRLNDFRFVNFIDRDLGVRASNIVHQIRNDGDDKWLFFCHGEDQTNRLDYVPSYSRENIRLNINGRFDVLEYNTLTGEIYTPNYKIKDGKTIIDLVMFTEDSYLFKLIPANEDKEVVGNAPKKPMPLELLSKNYIKLNDMVDYTLDEPNAILLDMCEYAFDGEDYQPLINSLRVSDIGREKFYLKHHAEAYVQPWVPVPEELKNDKGHLVKRKFTFFSDITLENVHLALEEADKATIWVNGEELNKEFDGWYVDKCIKKVKLPTLKPGKQVIEVEIPFFLRGRTEWLYVLGDFGVNVTGKFVTAKEKAKKLAFGNAVNQTLPFYTGNITYHTSYVETEKTNRTLQIAQFGGALARVKVDGKDIGVVAISPNTIDLGVMEKGEHKIDITVFGTRFNGFGPVHNTKKHTEDHGPRSWRTYDSPMWSDCYILHPTGILNNPVIY